MPDNSYDRAKATKKTTTTSTNRAYTPSKSTKKVENKIKKEIKKKFSTGALIIILVCLIIGAGIGYFGTSLLFKNDCFVMNKYDNDMEDIYIGDDEDFQSYTELGVKCIAFGKDISNEVQIKYMYREDISHDIIEVSEIDVNTSGVYYAVYTVSNIKYKGVELIRNIIVLRGEE